MNKMRNLISVLLGLLALAALAVGLAWLLGTQGALPAQQASPLRTPTPQERATPTPMDWEDDIEPTPPSEDWPTLTPFPTWPRPTLPPGPTVVKPSPTPIPLPTRPPLLLTPIPTGEPPEDLWSILYLPLEDKLAVHGVLVDTQGRRWSDPWVVYDFRRIDLGPHTCLANLTAAPAGDWLAVAVTYLESNQTWLLDLTSQEPRLVSACEGYQGCRVRDWSPDGEAIILELYPFGDHPFEFVMMEVDSGMAVKLHIPETTLTYSSVVDVTFSPDGRSIVWTIGGAGDHGETTQVWLTDSKGEQAWLLISETGLIWNVSLSPDGSQIAYSFAAGRQQKASVRLLSIEHQESMPLVPSPDSFSNPAWSPDGLQVAITQCADVPPGTSLADHQCNVSVLDRRSGLISPAVVHPGRVYWDVSWSPDAGLLAFLSASDKELQAIWLFSSETGKSYPVSGYLRPFSEYAWLPFSFAGER